jgi:hypothetical protein
MRGRATARPHRPLTVAAALVVTGVLGLLGGTVWIEQARRAEAAQRARAEEAR